MSRLESLYIELGEPEGELCGCTCEVGDWAADEIERLRATLEGIASADWRNWEELASPDEFVIWAKSRAHHALTHNAELNGRGPKE